MKTFKLQIITPDKILYDDNAEQVIVRTSEGDVGILAGHENYAAILPSGVLKLTADGKEIYAAIASGFIKVNYNKDVKIIASAAEWGKDIDIIWAKKSKEDALNKIKYAETKSQMTRAELKLKRAANRIKVSELYGK